MNNFDRKLFDSIISWEENIQYIFLCSNLKKDLERELFKDKLMNKTILDLCCGSTAQYARNYSDKNKCVALDVDARALKLFKKIYKDREKLDVECVIADAENMPFRDKVFYRTYVSFAMSPQFAKDIQRVTSEVVVISYLRWEDKKMKMISKQWPECNVIKKNRFYNGLDYVGVFYIHLNLDFDGRSLNSHYSDDDSPTPSRPVQLDHENILPRSTYYHVTFDRQCS